MIIASEKYALKFIDAVATNLNETLCLVTLWAYNGPWSVSFFFGLSDEEWIAICGTLRWVRVRDTPIRELTDGRRCNLLAEILDKPPELSLAEMSSARPQEQKLTLQSDSRSQLQGLLLAEMLLARTREQQTRTSSALQLDSLSQQQGLSAFLG